MKEFCANSFSDTEFKVNLVWKKKSKSEPARSKKWSAMDDTSEFEAASKDWLGFKFIQRKGLFNSVGAKVNSVLF